MTTMAALAWQWHEWKRRRPGLARAVKAAIAAGAAVVEAPRHTLDSFVAVGYILKPMVVDCATQSLTVVSSNRGALAVLIELRSRR